MGDYAVITENDISKWDDQTGVRYHFPNRYKKILNAGTKIIYYKGEMKDSKFLVNRLTRKAHYFGIATIRECVLDDSNSKDYYAYIDEYIPFAKPVKIRSDGGSYLENIPESLKKNYWRNGVRKISKDVYSKILKEAGINLDSELNEISIDESMYTKIDDIEISIIDDGGFVEYNKKNKTNDNKNNNSSNNFRFKKNTKKIGDRGEAVVYKHLNETLNKEEKSNLKWHEQLKEYPGYDFSYIDTDGKKHCIEVKATTGTQIKEFVLTRNEWDAAMEEGDNYYIYIVVSCFSKNPKIKILKNPYNSDELVATELSYLIRKK